MNKEIEQALMNIEAVCANTRLVGNAGLTRDEHANLAKQIKLIYDALVEADKGNTDVKHDEAVV